MAQAPFTAQLSEIPQAPLVAQLSEILQVDEAWRRRLWLHRGITVKRRKKCSNVWIFCEGLILGESYPTLLAKVLDNFQ